MARIHRLALQGKHAEDALVNPSERLSLDEALESFDAQRKLAECKRPLAGEAPRAQPLQMIPFEPVSVVPNCPAGRQVSPSSGWRAEAT